MGAGCTDTAHMAARGTSPCRENLIPILFPSLLMLNSLVTGWDGQGSVYGVSRLEAGWVLHHSYVVLHAGWLE